MLLAQKKKRSDSFLLHFRFLKKPNQVVEKNTSQMLNFVEGVS